MRKKFFASSVALLLVLLGISLSANATIIDFNSLSTGYHPSYSYTDTELDLKFDPSWALWVTSLSSAGTVPQASNGTNNLQYTQTMEVLDLSGNGFSLESLDIGTGIYMGSGVVGGRDTILITGYLSGGSSVSTSVSINETFNHVIFGAAWSNLSSVGFSGATTSSNGYIALDNFEVTAAAPVPEPATMLLFGAGLAGLVGSRIRKKKKQQ